MPRGIPNNAPSPSLSTDSRKLWIVLIGVNEYKDTAFPMLQYSVQDCLGLEEVLKRVTVERFADRKFLIHKDHPTLDAVCKSLERIAHEARSQDVVLIYFSGHGALIDQDLYFCLTDTWQDRLETTGLLLEQLLGYLEKCAASQQLLWSDACYSGGLPSSNGDTNQSTLFRDVLQARAQQNQGFYALLSCTASQRAWEFSGLKNGVFTYFLIRGLEGGAADDKRLVEVDRLYTYVSLQTERFIEDINTKRKILNEQNTEGREKHLELYPLQTPYRIVGGAGRLVLGLCQGQPAALQDQRHALVMHNDVNNETNLDFCRTLREHCDFNLSYWQEQNRFLSEAENTQKNTESLESSIVRVLNSDAKATVLLYFRGKVQKRGADIWLMCSDTVGVERTWLRKVLNQARVAYCILILDCQGARNIYELMASAQKKNFCILAAEDQDLFPQVLTQSFKEADPKFGLSLPAWIVSINKRLKERQQPLYRWLGGEEQRLMIAPEEHTPPLNRDLNLCPYLGLKTFSEKDVSYFYGREEITKQLVDRLENSAFLAVVGASGSGKSSVVQAGLIPRLRQRQLHNAQRWEILTIRPGTAPFDTLAGALSASSKISLESIKEKLEAGAEAFLDYLESRDKPCLFLVIDQFEELLTVAAKEESDRFIDLLINILEQSTHKNFKLVITLRSDFYVSDQLPLELNKKVIESNITLIPMDTDSYCEAIEEPAKRVGLKVEQSLVIRLLEDLKGSAGDLPLLAFVLQELWTKRQNGHLTLADYQQMQGIQGTLSRRANDIYDRMDTDQQNCLRWILVSLTKLGEKGALDSRQRIPKDKLFVADDPGEKILVEKTLKQLIDGKLVVVDFGSENQVVVEVAHEVLIRKWDKLEKWLNDNREQLQVLRDFQSDAEKWKKEIEKEEYLLRGSKLDNVENLSTDLVKGLSEGDKHFLQACQDNRAEIQRKENRRLRNAQVVTLVVSGLLVVTGYLAYIATQQTQKIQQEQIKLLNKSALSDLDKHPLDALMSSMEAAHLLKHTSGIPPELVDETTSTLRYISGMNQEVNRLEGHTDMVQTVAFSPDGSLLVSGGHDNTVRIWNREGKLLKTLTGHHAYISALAFSLDGKYFATSSQDGIVKLWDLNGNCLRTFVAYSPGLIRIIFSPDHQQLITSGDDGIIKFWDYQAKLLKSIKAHSQKIWKIVYSPDGTLLASASSDGQIKFWTPSGVLIKTLSGHKGFVTALAFSHDSQQIVSSGADKTLRVWSREGKLLRTIKGFQKDVISPQFTPDGRYLIFCASQSGDIQVRNLHTSLDFKLSGHTGQVISLTVSPDGRYLASASIDRSIRIWKIDSDFQMIVQSENPSNLVWSSNTGRIAVDTDNGKVNLYKPFHDFPVSIKAHLSALRELVLSPDGKMIATSSYEGNFSLLNTEGMLINLLPISVRSLSFTPDSQKILIGAFDGRIRFFNTAGIEDKVSSFIAHKGYINSVSINPDGQKILTSGEDGRTLLWSKQGQLLKRLGNEKSKKVSSAFSPNGQLILIRNESTLEIMNSQGNFLLSLPTQKKIFLALFSPDSQYLSTLYYDGFVDVWNVHGERIATLGKLPSDILNFDFSPDGKKLLTFGSLGSLLFWDWATNLDSLLEKSCTKMHSYLSNNISLTNQQREVCQDFPSP